MLSGFDPCIEYRPSVQTFAPLLLCFLYLSLCQSAPICDIWDQKHVCTLHGWKCSVIQCFTVFGSKAVLQR